MASIFAPLVTSPIEAGSLANLQKPSRKVLKSLQAGRAIAALMVVLFHCEDILSSPKYWNHSWKRLFYCGHSGVEFFFVLSGVVILHAHTKDFGRPERIWPYAWKRVRRVYPIYWIVLLITLPIFFLKPGLGTGMETHWPTILDSVLLVHLAGTHTVITVAWTLYHEIMFYAFFAIMLWRRRIGIGFLGLWFAASLLSLIHPPMNSFLAVYGSPLHLLFGFGMAAEFAARRVNLSRFALPLAGGGVLGFLVCCILENYLQHELAILEIAYGVMAAIAVTGFLVLDQAGRLTISRSLQFLGDASYSIYLVHFIALSLTAKIMFGLWKHHPTPLFIPFLLLAIVGVGAGSAVHVLVERPLNRLLSGPTSTVSAAGSTL